MCFSIRKKDKVARVAAEDIHCFKVLQKKSNGLYYSPSFLAKTTVWRRDRTIKEKNLIRIRPPYSSDINRGLHSLKTKSGARAWIRSRTDRFLFKAVIPQGSLYWENSGQYVSDQLVIRDITPQKLRVKSE